MKLAFSLIKVIVASINVDNKNQIIYGLISYSAMIR